MSNYPGRIISATPPSVSLGGASGVWTLEEALQYQKAGTWPVPPPNDPYFNNVAILLHGDGTNGAQNNTFIDSSTNNFTVTRNGNPTQGSRGPFSPAVGRYSSYWTGNNSYATIADNAALELGSSSFTIETWIYPLAVSSTQRIIVKSGAFSFNLLSGGGLSFGLTGGGSGTSSGTTVQPNTWSHIALTRNGNDFNIWLNGVSVFSGSNSGSMANTAGAWNIGRDPDGGPVAFNYYTGYMSNMRWTIGTALYTSTFTPSNAPFTTTSQGATSSEVELLTFQDEYLVDNSSNNFTVTSAGLGIFAGIPFSSYFSPFGQAAVYDPAVNGGSGYFDGSGDYLSIPDDAAFEFGSGDFTLEAWLFTTTTATEKTVFYIDGFVNGYAAVRLAIDSAGKLVLLMSSSGTSWALVEQGIGPSISEQWAHIACTKSGTNVRLYVNGAQVGSTYTFSGSVTNGTKNYIGVIEVANTFSNLFNGYVSNARIIKGQALYTGATYTIPNAPLTTTGYGSTSQSITGTVSLLCNFTNAGIFDNAGTNIIRTVADAQIDTSVKKYGTGSLKFDGTGDYLEVFDTYQTQLGLVPFTIECWVYVATGDSRYGGIAGKGAGNFNTGWQFTLNLNNTISFLYGVNSFSSTGTITLDAWNHVAVVREGTGSNQTKLYINGVNDGQATVNYSLDQGNLLYVGAHRGGIEVMKGWIDDFRITKGVARYTGNFTPPTQAFPNF
jgi:hypothetical protein